MLFIGFNMKKSFIILSLGILVLGSVIAVIFYPMVADNTKYSAIDIAASKEIYNTHHNEGDRYGFCLDGDQIYYSWDGLYDLHISASDESGRRDLIDDLRLSKGTLVGEVQAYDGVVYFPAKTDAGDCIFFCYRENEEENGLKEVARVKANLGPWTVIGQTLIFSDYGTTYTNENYTLYLYDLVSGETQTVSSFVYGFSVRTDKLFFLTGNGDDFTIYEYDLANDKKVAVGEFRYSQNGEVLGMTDETVIMHMADTTDTDILIYNIAQKRADVYTLPWKVNCFSVYEKYAFLGFYHDSNGSTEEVKGLYRMNLQNGELQVVNEEIHMPTSLFLINDSCAYVATYESKWLFTKAVVYRFSLDDSSFEEVFSW